MALPLADCDPSALRFRVGARVECRRFTHWQPGTVVDLFYEQTDFAPGMCAPFQVELDDGTLIFAPRDDNDCIRAEFVQLDPGTRGRIHGLKSRAELNGQCGIIMSYVGAKRRYLVRTKDMRPSDVPLALQPENITAVEATAWLGRCDGLGAFNVALHDEAMGMVARVCLRVHEGLSKVEGTCDLVPEQAYIQVSSDLVGRQCNSVDEALQASSHFNDSRNDSRDRGYTVKDAEPPPRAWYVRCSPALVAGALTLALEATSMEEKARAQNGETSSALSRMDVISAFGEMAGPQHQLLRDFVVEWADGTEAKNLMGMVATFDLEAAAYYVLNHRGEYQAWGFVEAMRQHFRKGYMAQKRKGAGSNHQLRSRLKDILGALANDSSAHIIISKCDLMCEHMAAFHLLADQKAIAALLLTLRDNVRELGLRESAIGFALMLVTPTLPDGTDFTPIAQAMLAEEDTVTHLSAVFTFMPVQKALELHYKSLNSDGGLALKESVETGTLSFHHSVNKTKEGGLTEEDKQMMQKNWTEDGIKSSFQISTLKISDYAHIDDEAGAHPGGGHWTIFMHTYLSERHNVLDEPGERLGPERDIERVREWIHRGFKSRAELEATAADGDPHAMLKLADILMCTGLGVTDETRDSQRACQLYYDAAGYGVPDAKALPEAMIAVAHIGKSKLLGRSGLDMQERHLEPHDAEDPVYIQMIYWMGRAAKRGWVAPLTLFYGKQALITCGLAGSDLQGAEDVVAAISARELSLAKGIRDKVKVTRQRSVQEAMAQADADRTRGNEAIQAGDNAAAASAYDCAITALSPFESELGVAWPLVLCLSNHGEAMLRLHRYAEALDSCNDAAVLLERYEPSFDASEMARIARKLDQREKSATHAAETAAEEAERAAASQEREARKEEHQERVLREQALAAAKQRSAAAKRAAKASAKRQRHSEEAARKHEEAAREASQAEAAEAEILERQALEQAEADRVRAQREAKARQAAAQRAEEVKAGISQREARNARRRMEREARNARRQEVTRPSTMDHTNTWASEEFTRHLQLEEEQRAANEERARRRWLGAQERVVAQAEFQACAAAPRAAPDDAECCICLGGGESAPLEDFCDHEHWLHAGCARLWRDQCRDRKQEPHCPTCQREWTRL